MSKKNTKLKPDTILKNYWSSNEQFADLFNAVLFKGEQMISPEELVDADTEESGILEHREYAESIQASRDTIKVRKKSSEHSVELVLLAKEAQEFIHYAMPVRVMGYDYGSYKKQYDSNAKKYKTSAGLNEDEYLSRMKKTDKLIPVITVSVYYGEKPWDGATTLHGMLNIPESMAEFVSDYRILLVEARQNNLKLHNTNNIDLFNLLGILLDKSQPTSEAKTKAIAYANTHRVDRSVIMTVAGAANCRLDYNILDWKGDANMCTVFEETWAEGRAAEIVESGYEFGLSEQEILERLQRKLTITPDKAREYLAMFQKTGLQAGL